MESTDMYAPFYRAAGIDAAMAKRFEALLREHEEQQRDLQDIVGELPGGDRNEVIVAPNGTERERVDPALTAMRRRMAAQWEADQIACSAKSVTGGCKNSIVPKANDRSSANS